MKLLVSKTCPFAQRAWITANALKVDCEIEIIDLKNKPDWFLALTDFAKVPVLIDDQQRVLWESMVVSNYLNELHDYKLNPKDRFVNAINDAWIQHVGIVQSLAYHMASAENTTLLEQVCAGFCQQLQPVEKALQAGPYFNGKQFCMIDIFYAPVFLRAKLIAEYYNLDLYANLPKIANWSDQLIEHPAVTATVLPEFAQLFTEKYFTNHE